MDITGSPQVDATHNRIEQYKERLHGKATGLFGDNLSSGHKPQSYSGAPTIPPVVVPVSGVLILLKSKVTSCIQLSQ